MLTPTPAHFANSLSLRCWFIAIALMIGTSPCVLAQNSTPSEQSEGIGQLKWFKGNLHTHSLWSDGDDFPEMIAAWYAERGYNFLALSDHNTLSRGQKWMALTTIIQRADEGILGRYHSKFGEHWVETRSTAENTTEVRLKPLDEFRCLVEQAGHFIMIEGEEISGQASGKPIHMNFTNASTAIQPANGATAQETMRNILRQAKEQADKTQRSTMVHLNHPNFHYAVTAEDLANVVEEQFFEVYNGHPGVNHLGDEDHISIEAMWDLANAIRLQLLSAQPLLGIGTDDSHEYHGRPGSRPGRGWVMVRARYLTPEHLIAALKSGDFYASSGVVLNDIQYDTDQKKLELTIAPAEGETFKTEFIATIRSEVATELPSRIGEVVATSSSLTPSYTFTGEELYVRARVTSSAGVDDPAFENQKRQAWTQPIVATQPPNQAK